MWTVYNKSYPNNRRLLSHIYRKSNNSKEKRCILSSTNSVIVRVDLVTCDDDKKKNDSIIVVHPRRKSQYHYDNNAATSRRRYYSSKSFHYQNNLHSNFHSSSSHSKPSNNIPSSHSSSSSSSSTTTTPPFHKILIANRGEISRRIIKTCHSLDIPTVAIHSTIDSKSPHVLEATESFCIGPPSSTNSYLNVDVICKAIEMTGADGVHPGYGFLSENHDFCRRVSQIPILNHNNDNNSDNDEKGPRRKFVSFIGPNPDAILAMGDKITSKRIALEAGVNVIPGHDDFVSTPDEAVHVARTIGYPVMIKATSGGGGKGMRICYNDNQVKEGFALSTAEAKNFFNDERLFIEKFIEKPHHIEIQVLSGINPQTQQLDILCFPERECSIQRRNQKIIEESPSTLLQPTTRAKMIQQVKSLVRNTNYESAGTVEFLVDENQNFYFLEMNTRLQVEHPVTELVSGDVDIVKGMIMVAAGLGVPQEYLELVDDGNSSVSDGLLSVEEKEGLCVPYRGHAIEARIYAEDPFRGFLPSIGPLIQYIEPPTTLTSSHENDNSQDHPKIRVDSGVVAGSIISQYYDPMISKLIAYSPNNRSEAIASLTDAIDRYVIRGVGHNISFISDVLQHAEFKAGNTPTNFIEKHYPDGFHGIQFSLAEYANIAAVSAIISALRREMLGTPPLPLSSSIVNRHDTQEVIICIGSGMFGDAYRVRFTTVGDEAQKVFVQNVHDRTGMKHKDHHSTAKTFTCEIEIDKLKYDPCWPIIEVEINGENRAYQIQSEDNTGNFQIKSQGMDLDVLVMSPEEYKLSLYMNQPKVVDTSNLVLSPMPGTLVSYAVKEGDHVVTGQEICIVEAMKMQNVLRSSRSGVVKKCYPKEGSSLMADEIIVEFSV